jgi:proline iminopeptidase
MDSIMPEKIRFGNLASLLTAALLLPACLGCGAGDEAPPPTHIPPGEGLRDVNGIELFVKTVGAGGPVLVLHGGPGLDHSYLLPGLEGLAAEHTLIFYDQRGTGRSALEVDSAFISMEAFLGDIEAIRNLFGLERMDVLGHSWGTYLAMAYAARYPPRVSRLVLMNPIEPGSTYDAEVAGNLAARRTAADSVEMARLAGTPPGLGDPDVLARYFAVGSRATFHDPSRSDELPIRFFASTLANVPRIGPLLFRASGGRADMWEELPGIRAPTLIVRGASDPTPPAMLERLAKAIPNAQSVVLEQSGHFPGVEVPEALTQVLTDFLRR